MKVAQLTLFVLLLASAAQMVFAADPVWDSSGNSLLNGTYNFREVTWGNKGDLHRIAIYGSIQFDGNGSYTLTSQVMDSNVGAPQPFSAQGAYRISASGMGFMDDPTRRNAVSPSSTMWGLVSQGIFIGSSTDDGNNNLFVAALASPSAPTNASFHDSYWAAGVNLPSGNVAEARDMLFRLNPDGLGGLGTVSLTGLVGLNTAPVTQTVPNAVYSFANGVFTLGLGSGPQQQLIAGTEQCYLSADGNFFFGGSATGFDMIVGVRAITGDVPANLLNGMYYQAGADVTPSKGFETLSTYYGAFSALADSGILIGHQRILPNDPGVNFVPYDYTYSDVFALAPDGTSDDFSHFHHIVGAQGAIQIGFGNGSRLGINIALRAPDFSESGVYLKPDGIANAASSAPFTVGVSRGGFVALYGSNLAPGTFADSRTPTRLGGVQVLINERPAPLYFVRSDVILAIVPFATTGGVASIQVINNGVASAARTVRIKDGTPGIFTDPAGGVGLAIAQHVQDQSYALVTPQNPARPGEMVLVYLTGLGDVNPPVADGVPAPVSPSSLALRAPFVLVDGTQAAVGFAGLWPGSIGVYGITFRVPATTSPGNKFLNISLPDSYTTEAQVPVGPIVFSTQSQRSSLEKQPEVRIPAMLRRFPDRP